MPIARRGPLEIGLIDRSGGSNSIVQQSISLQMHRFEKILDSGITKVKTELLENKTPALFSIECKGDLAFQLEYHC